MTERIVMAHGGGGSKMHELIARHLVPAYGGPVLARLGDGAVLEGRPGRLAFATDSFVVRPYVFPGGDIGELAVNGTVNDLAMCGARPSFLSVGLILEEGLALEDLDRIAASIARAARRAGLEIVTGDTKVVERGKGDGIYINTSGVGWIPEDLDLGPERVRAGDAVLLSGPIGEHGIAVLSVREGIAFASPVVSDTMPLETAARALLAEPEAVRMMRDPTRGGLAATLNEIAAAARVGIRIDESRVPVSEGVRAACEILGLDPFGIANEGRLVAVVDPARAAALLEGLRAVEGCGEARAIGEIVEDARHLVTVTTPYGGERVLDLSTGEALPRIC